MADTYTPETLAEAVQSGSIIQFTITNEGADPATGYMKKPSIDMKLRLLDAITNGNAATVSSQILEGHLLRESDPRISKTNDEYWLGAVAVVIRTVRSASGEIKKN